MFGFGTKKKAAAAVDLHLDRIVILYRDDEGVLWGIPYDMKGDRSPRAIEHLASREWTYLGKNGNLSWASRENAAEIKAFTADHLKRQLSWGEWSYV